MRYKNIIFDIDGTLLDTVFADLTGLREALLDAFGIDYPISELQGALGVPSIDILRKYNIPEGDIPRLIQRWEDGIQRNFDSVSLFPGIRETVTRLETEGFELGIVTSKTQKEFATDFPQFGIAEMFGVIITADDTLKHKPFPEPLLKYLEYAGASAEQSIYIGDSVYDLQSAKDAGIDFAVAEWLPNCPIAEEAKYRLKQPSDLFAFL